MAQGIERKALLTRRQVVALLAGFGVAANAWSQDAAKVDGRSYRVVFENDRVRVLEYRSRPGSGICGHGTHSHPDHLTVLLTDSRARVTRSDGATFVADGKAGDIFWEPAATHSTENIGGANARAYMIEMKGGDWRPSTG